MSAHSPTLKQNQILVRIDSFIRKPVSQAGCRQLVNIAKQTDLSYIPLLISTSDKYLTPAFTFWHKYKHNIAPTVSLLMNTLYSKITYSKLDHLRMIFDRLKKKYELVSMKRVQLLEQAHVSMQQSDIKLKNYASELEKTKNQYSKERGVLIHQEQKEQTPVTVIQVNKQLGKNYLKTRIQALKDLYFKIKISHQKAENKKIEAKLIQKLQQHPIISRDCINCIGFVYQDEDLSFPMCKQPVTYFGKILTIGNMQRQIMQQIVSYLNGKGGILLIGVQKVNNQILPIVQEIAQFHKEQQQTRIQASLGNIMPAVTMNKQVELSYIPIAENCRKNPENTHPIWKQNGACIMRITVTPTDPHKTYFYAVPSTPTQPDPNAQNVSLQAVQPTAAFNIFRRHTVLGDEQLKSEEIYDFMKARYRQYDPSLRPTDFVLRDRGNYHPCLIRHIDRCRPPQKGSPFYGNRDYYEQNSKKRQYESKSTNPLLQGPDIYKNITLLVVMSSLIDRISTMFSLGQKLQNKIIPAFKSENFRLSNNTFLLFHNCKFQKLKIGLNKQRAQLKHANDKKDVILISTLNILSIKQDQLKKNIEKQLQERVYQVAKEKIQFKFIDRVCYIKCPSTITAVYVYFYLQHHHGIRGKFQKIPTGSNAKSKQYKGNSKTIKSPQQRDNNGKKRERRQREDYSDSYSDDYSDYSDEYESKQPSPKKQNFSKKEKDYNNRQEQNQYQKSQNEQVFQQEQQNSHAISQSDQVMPSENDQNMNQEVQAVFLTSQFDYVNGIRYDYYNNSVVCMYSIINNQYLGYQYYQMPS